MVSAPTVDGMEKEYCTILGPVLNLLDVAVPKRKQASLRAGPEDLKSPSAPVGVALHPI